MTQIFGEVASMYDDVRPAYPDQVLDAITEYHGGAPASVVDLGAGTGKGTELLVRLDATLSISNTRPMRIGGPNFTTTSDMFHGSLDSVYAMLG